MRGGVPVQGDHPWGAVLLNGPEEKPFSRSHITPSAQEEVDRAARFIHGAIQVDPLASDLEGSLIQAPALLK